MIRRELLSEEFRFACEGCFHAWNVVYDVQHVEDGHGHRRDYFFRNRYPIADPRAPQAVTCPDCRSPHVRMEVTTARTTPAASIAGTSTVTRQPGTSRLG